MRLPRLDRTLGSAARSAKGKKGSAQADVVLVYEGMMFWWPCASRNTANRELIRPTGWETLKAAFPELDTVPPIDAVAPGLERLSAEHLEPVLLDAVKRLLRSRRLAGWMVQHHHLVAVDRWAQE
jgi:hypothetical protein